MASGLDGAKQFQARLAAVSDTHQILGMIALRAVAEAKLIVPRKTGNLGRTIRLGRVDADSAEVLAGGKLNVGYAKAVEFGTRAHIIRPRNRKALAWGGPRTLAGGLRSGGKPTHFSRLVHHPGTKAKPYLIPGIRRAFQFAGLKVHIRDAWNRAA